MNEAQKKQKWQQVYGETPDRFRQRVAEALPGAENQRRVFLPRRAVAGLLMLTTAFAAVVTHTELVWNAGKPIETPSEDRLGLLTGKTGTSGDRVTLDGVSFTMLDAVYSTQEGVLFASAAITADAPVQLVAVDADMEHEVRLDSRVSDVLGDSDALGGSGQTWAQWAEENGKTLVPVRMETAANQPETGIFTLQQPDGSVSVGIQVNGVEADEVAIDFVCSVGVFGDDGKAGQWQERILHAVIRMK